jgi:hypothetical protein
VAGRNPYVRALARITPAGKQSERSTGKKGRQAGEKPF